jgi:DNA-binding transcriptional MerR regulator
MMIGMTIGQAAAFAGVTIKTVRHYHRLGLIEEPERDGSGYRRYRSTDLLRLVQVRTLAGAGVPLAEIAALLDADPERFEAALTEVERELTNRIEELIDRRQTLRRLAGGDRVLLPDRAGLHLASALADNLLAHPELLAIPAASFQAQADFAARYGLINYHRQDQLPTSARLTELVDAQLRAAGLDVP